jgi:hypothetical protein
MSRFFALLLIASVLATTAVAQQFSTPILVSTNSSSSEQRSPIMHLDHNGTIYICWVSGNGDGSSIFVSKSSDKGKTFSTPVLACANANSNSDMQRTTKFAIDPGGNLHFIWMATRVNKQPDIWYMRSTDQGENWTTPVSLSNDDSKYAQDFPAIACDSQGNIYASFLDFRESAQPGIPSHGRLYVTRSIDGGATWSKNITADSMPNGIGGTCECCAQHIAVSAAGNIYIAFRSNTLDANNNNVRNIYLARSTDQGLSFQPSLNIQDTDWILTACPMKGPNIVLDESETAHIVWADGRTFPSHLYYTSVTPGETTTPLNTTFDVAGAEVPNCPEISTIANGKYRAIVYQTSNYGARYLLYSHGIAIVNNRPFPSGQSQMYPSVLFAPDGIRYCVWQDSKLGKPNIYFSKETVGLETESVKESIEATSLSMYPNPLSLENRTITISQQEASASSIRVVDELGRERFSAKLSNSTSQTVELPGLSEGNYLCVFHTGSTIQTRMLSIK